MDDMYIQRLVNVLLTNDSNTYIINLGLSLKELQNVILELYCKLNNKSHHEYMVSLTV